MGLFENIKNEPVSRLDVRQPVLVQPTDTVRKAIAEMHQAGLGCAIVIDTDRKPVGMLTESIVVQLIAKGVDYLDDAVLQHMADRFAWVASTDPVAQVLESMQIKNVRFLCVVDQSGCVTGLTGQKGLMEYVADHFPNQVMVQRIGREARIHQREGA